MDIDSISNNLKKLRNIKGMSIYELAGRVGTSVPTISRYENGWNRFEIYTLQKIATALGFELVIDFKVACRVNAPKTSSGAIKRLSRLFWDHKLTAGDLEKHPVWVVERIVEFGSLKDVRTLINLYGKKTFLKYVSKCRFESRKTENFWKKMLEKEGIKCMKKPFPREARFY